MDLGVVDALLVDFVRLALWQVKTGHRIGSRSRTQRINPEIFSIGSLAVDVRLGELDQILCGTAPLLLGFGLDAVKLGLAGYLFGVGVIPSVGIDYHGRTFHRRHRIGGANLDLVAGFHELAGHIDHDGSGLQIDGRARAAPWQSFFAHLEAAELFNGDGGFAAEQDARQRFLAGVDDIADDDIVFEL